MLYVIVEADRSVGEGTTNDVLDVNNVIYYVTLIVLLVVDCSICFLFDDDDA